MGKTACWKLTLSQVETFVLFAALLLAIISEGACVYWLSPAVAKPSTLGVQSPNVVGEWAAATLPQCWLLGALPILFCRVSAMLVPPQSWGLAETQSNRRAFLRLWRWTAALGALQVGALYMDLLTMGAH